MKYSRRGAGAITFVLNFLSYILFLSSECCYLLLLSYFAWAIFIKKIIYLLKQCGLEFMVLMHLAEKEEIS